MARAQLPRRHPGLRPRRDHRGGRPSSSRSRPVRRRLPTDLATRCSPASPARRSTRSSSARSASTLYGLMIALGVVAAVWLFGRRFEERAVGTRDDANAIAVWAVLAGVIGARLYHVATDWREVRGQLGRGRRDLEGRPRHPGRTAPRRPGRDVRGAPAGDRHRPSRLTLVGARASRSPRRSAAGATTSTRSSTAGRPTLPWAVRDRRRSPRGRLSRSARRSTRRSSTSRCGTSRSAAAAAVDRPPVPLRPGQLMAMYVIGYGIGRFWVEGLRIDEAHHVAGLRLNQWIALSMVVGGTVAFVRGSSMRRYPSPRTPSDVARSTRGTGRRRPRRRDDRRARRGRARGQFRRRPGRRIEQVGSVPAVERD